MLQELKVHIIHDWKPLKMVKDIQHFLGFTKFYHKFIWGYTKIVGLLHDLLHKNCIFEWGSQQQTTFEELKQVITTAPILQLPHLCNNLYLTCNTSGNTLEAVFVIKRKSKLAPVAFMYWWMSRHEENYNIHNKKLFAIINALEKWKHHLFGVKVHVQTDHKGLEYFFSKKNLQSCQVQWAETCVHFDFHIQYKPNKVNVVANAFTRLPTLKMAYICSQPPNHNKFIDAYTKDPFFQKVFAMKNKAKEFAPNFWFLMT